MLYDIRLSISYRYQSPAKASRNILRIMPRPQPQQQLIAGTVRTDPAPGFRRDGTDFFGNVTTEVAHDQSLSEIAFHFEGRVRRDEEITHFDLSRPLRDLRRDLAMARDLGPDAPHHYLGASPRVPADPEISHFAQSGADDGASVLSTVRMIRQRVHGYFDFDPAATEVTTTPIEAFRARRGVCQDLSHVTIAALRSLGIPAGYVSGFLRTVPPEGQERLEGADAMHAWVRAWCGQETGWVEIDPTNDVDVAADHIVVAHGRDYGDVAPVKGSIRSQGMQATDHKVDVVPV